MSFSEFIQHYGYIAIYIGCLIEGETVLILGSAAAKLHQLSLSMVVIVGGLSGFTSDLIFYLLGRYFGLKALRYFSRYEEKIEKAKSLIQRYDIGFIICVRFFYGFRIIGPLLLGTSKISFWRFFILNFIGALIWSCIFSAIGYLFGATVIQWLISLNKEHIEIAIIIIIILVVAWIIWKRKRKKSRSHRH